VNSKIYRYMVDNCGKWMKGGRKLQDGNEAAEG
jgi:hypothetical protein